jgi:hypothetical protein
MSHRDTSMSCQILGLLLYNCYDALQLFVQRMCYFFSNSVWPNLIALESFRNTSWLVLMLALIVVMMLFILCYPPLILHPSHTGRRLCHFQLL